MPVLPTMKRRELLARGGEARIWLGPRNYVVKELQASNSASARYRYWAHRIAFELFPENILRYNAASDREGKAVLVSKRIPVDEDHLHLMRKYTDSLEWRPHTPNCSICLRAAGPRQKELLKAFRELAQAGVVVDWHESNFALVNKKPFFFEVEVINTEKVREHLKTKPPEVREKIEKMLQKYEPLHEELVRYLRRK